MNNYFNVIKENIVKSFLLAIAAMLFFMLAGCSFTKSVDLYYQPLPKYNVKGTSSKKLAKPSVKDIRGVNPNFLGSFVSRRSTPQGIEVDVPLTYNATSSLSSILTKALLVSFKRAGYLVSSTNPELKLYAKILKTDLYLKSGFLKDTMTYKIIARFELKNLKTGKMLWRKTITAGGSHASAFSAVSADTAATACNSAINQLIYKLLSSKTFRRAVV